MPLKLLIILSFLTSSFLIAQERNGREQEGFNRENIPKIGKISGIIIDNSNNKPIEFSTVALYSLKDSSLINGVIAKEDGSFLIEELSYGRYFLKLNFIGYNELIIDTIKIRPNGVTNVDLGKIKLVPNTEILKTVEVSASRGDMTIGIDRKIFNVENSIVSQGGSANDVLQQIPSVDVDLDGNISLRGNGNVTVLIDGKPSGLTGSSRQAILQQIPANSIESIEVITNPSAKYDPDGMSGIINIVMKKNKLKGFNGGISIGAGTRDKYNGSANISYRNKKFNAYVNYGYRLDNRFREGYSNRQNLLSDTTFYLSENSLSNRKSISNNIKGGIEFYLNEFNTIGASILYNESNDSDPEKSTYQEFDNFHLLGGAYSRAVIEKGNKNNLDYTLDYKKTFTKPKQELIFSATYSDSKGKDFQTFEEFNQQLKYEPAGLNPLWQKIRTSNKNDITTLQVDYTHPLNKNKLEIGAKSIIRNIDNDFYSQSFNYSNNLLEDDTLLNNHFVYNEQIHAGYITFGGIIKRFGYQLGLRAEQAFTQFDLVTTNEKFKRDFLNFFPSIHLSQKLKKEQELQLSFSRRINRPNTREMNPFKNYTDPYNIRFGNPYLKPEYTNSYELAYLKYFKKFVLTSSIYYRQTTGVISYYKFLGDSTISYVTHLNLTSSTSYGFELIAKIDLFKWWNMTASGNVFQNKINGTNIETDLNNENFSYSGKLISNMKFFKNLDFQISSNYRGPWATPQGIAYGNLSIDIGIKKEIFKNAYLSFNVSDITNARRFKIEGNTTTFVLDMYRKRESRVATLTFNYSFGNLSEGAKKGRGNRGQNSGGGDFGGDDMGM